MNITVRQPITRDTDNPPPENGVAGNIPDHVLKAASEGHEVESTPDTGWENVVQANNTLDVM
jgi:hypothetical protein